MVVDLGDITRDLKRLQDEKEAAVNKRAQVCPI